MPDKKYTFYREGNAPLSKSINSYLYQRDKLTNDLWNKEIYPILKQTRNDIITKLKSYDNLTDWQVYNMRRIQDSLQEIINKMEMQFKAKLTDAQNKMFDFDADMVTKQAKLSKLNTGMQLVVSHSLTEALIPLSEQFVTFFSKDMSKIIMADVSIGLVKNEGAGVIAKTIYDKFGNTEKQIALFKSDKERWDSYLKQGKVSQERYDKRISYLNTQLQKGSMMSLARAKTIAKTEILTASSIAREARQQEIIALNKDVLKTWIHSGSAHGREAHIEAEKRYKENPIPVDEPFIIDGEEGFFPRDISFSAKNRINCACMHLLLNKEYL